MNALRTGLFSVSYAGLWGQEFLPLKEVIEKAAGMGFEGVLIMGKKPHFSPLEVTDREIRALRKVFSGSGIEAVGIAGYNDFFMPAPAEVPVEEMQLAYIDACCRTAAALGGSLVRIFTSYERDGTMNPSEGWKRMVELLRNCGDRACRYDITIAVQNHHDFAVDTGLMDLLLDEVSHPNVRAGFDAWSPFLRGEDVYAGARKMAHRTALTIAANYRRFPRYQYEPELVNYSKRNPDFVRATFMSRGEIDYRRFFDNLREGGYSGWAVYETCSPLIEGSSGKILDEAAADFLKYFDKTV